MSNSVIILGGGRVAAPIITGYDVYRTWMERGVKRKQLAASFMADQFDEACEYADDKSANSTYLSYVVREVVE